MPKLTLNDLNAEFSDTSARNDHPGRKGFELAPPRIFGWLFANATDGNDKAVPIRRQQKPRRLTRAERRLRTGLLATL